MSEYKVPKALQPKFEEITEIWNALDLMLTDPNYSTGELLESNPMVWFLSVNGLLVDVRTMPREVHEIAYEHGLIPYIPADRDEGEAE